MRYARPAALVAMLAVLVSGCGSPRPSSPVPSVAPTLESVPTSRPSGPPSEPTDNDKPTGWIVGTVTAGGTGPCYGLVTDEGVPYALHSTAGLRLEKGSRVRVKGTPAKIRIYCGPGELLEMTAAEPLR